MTTLEIRASRGRQVALVLAFAFFGFGAVIMLLSGEILQILVALLGLALFGTVAIHRWRVRRVTTLKLDDTGVTLGFGGHVPWKDVIEFGVFRLNGPLALGIKLSDSSAYVASLTPEQARLLVRVNKLSKGSAPLIAAYSPADIGTAMTLSKVPTTDLVATLAWTRNYYGYELFFGPFDLPESPRAVMRRCEAFRTAVQGSASPGTPGTPSAG